MGSIEEDQEILQGDGNPMPAYLSTQPPANMNWQITLKDKVIAITGVSNLLTCNNPPGTPAHPLLQEPPASPQSHGGSIV